MNIYVSPYKVFGLSPTANEVEIEHHRARVLVQLMDVAPKEQVYLNGTTIAQEQAMKLLSELSDDTIRSYHIAIFQNKKLLNFLEYGHLNYFRVEQPIADDQRDGFYEFIAPYFATQYSETLMQAIQTHDTETLKLLSNSNLPMVIDFEDQYYHHVNRYVQSTIDTLKRLQKDVQVETLSEHQLMAYLPNKTIELYNMLPDYFLVARNLIGNEVYQAALVMSQRLGREDSAAVLIRQGLKLRLDTTVRQNLQDLLDRFKLRYKVPSFIIFGIMAVLLLFFIKFLENTFFSS